MRWLSLSWWLGLTSGVDVVDAARKALAFVQDAVTAIERAGLDVPDTFENAVKFLKAALESPEVAAFLRWILGSDVTTTSGDARNLAIQSAMARHEATLKPAVANAGIEWDKLLPVLLFVVRLILTFTGRRG